MMTIEEWYRRYTIQRKLMGVMLKDVGVKTGSLQRVKTGEFDPPISMVKTLLDSIGCDIVLWGKKVDLSKYEKLSEILDYANKRRWNVIIEPRVKREKLTENGTMTAEGFFRMVQELRIKEGLSVKDVGVLYNGSCKSNALGYTFDDVRVNSNLQTVIAYLGVMGYILSINNSINNSQRLMLSTNHFVDLLFTLKNREGSQIALAKKIGISASTINFILSKKHSVSMEMFLKIIQTFDYEVKLLKKN